MRARSLLLLAGCAVALALSASAQQQRPRVNAARVAAARKAQAQPQAPAQVVAPPPSNPAQSRPLQIDMQAAIRQSKTPTSAIGGLVNAGFVISNRPAIDRVKIPVLLPVDPDIALGMKFFPNGEFYTVSSTSRGMSFVLTGAGRAFPLPPAIARPLPKASLASRVPLTGSSSSRPRVASTPASSASARPIRSRWSARSRASTTAARTTPTSAASSAG